MVKKVFRLMVMFMASASFSHTVPAQDGNQERYQAVAIAPTIAFLVDNLSLSREEGGVHGWIVMVVTGDPDFQLLKIRTEVDCQNRLMKSHEAHAYREYKHVGDEKTALEQTIIPGTMQEQVMSYMYEGSLAPATAKQRPLDEYSFYGLHDVLTERLSK